MNYVRNSISKHKHAIVISAIVNVLPELSRRTLIALHGNRKKMTSIQLRVFVKI